MNREKTMLSMLETSSRLQQSVSLILEAKAVEAEKARAWLCGHLRNETFTEFDEQLKRSLEIHDQLIEVIDGITKLENGLTRNLETLLNKGGSDGDSEGGFGGMFGGVGGLGG